MVVIHIESREEWIEHWHTDLLKLHLMRHFSEQNFYLPSGNLGVNLDHKSPNMKIECSDLVWRYEFQHLFILQDFSFLFTTHILIAYSYPVCHPHEMMWGKVDSCQRNSLKKGFNNVPIEANPYWSDSIFYQWKFWTAQLHERWSYAGQLTPNSQLICFTDPESLYCSLIESLILMTYK